MGVEIWSLIMLAFIVVAICMGLHVFLALGAVPLLFGLIFIGPRVLNMFPVNAFGMFINYAFVAVPLFVYMGTLMEDAGVAEKLYEAFYQLLGPVRAGLSLATIAMATVFGACTGIVGAGVILIGLLALPSMLSRGYNVSLATGSVMTGGGLAVMIPPSLMLILYGCSSGVSISELYLGSTIPGVLLGIMYMVGVYIWALFDKTIGRPISKEERIRGMALLKLVSINLLPPIFLIFAVMGSIFFGLVGPSEAGAMGVLGAAVLVAINGRFNMETLKKSTTTAVKICTAVLFICLGGQVFIGVFIMMGGDVALKTIILGFHFGPFGTLLVMLTIVWILGFVMDWIALIFILTPIYTSLLTFLGIDQLYFGILFCSTLAISNMTPPFAYSAFYLRTIAPKSITMAQIYLGCVPFFWINTAMVAVILWKPWFVMWLPRIAYK